MANLRRSKQSEATSFDTTEFCGQRTQAIDQTHKSISQSQNVPTNRHGPYKEG